MKPSLLAALVLGIGLSVPAHANVIKITNLVTDDQGANPAQITDPNLINAWGMSYNLTGSPFWISDNGTGVSTLYSVNGTTNATAKVALTEGMAGDKSVTGQIFNSVAGNFGGSNFMFVNEDGTIAGRVGAGNPATVIQAASDANVYKGAAFAAITTGTTTNGYLYAANFRAGTIDVLKGNALAPDLTGTFTDPTLPPGYAPFNIQKLDGKLYVAYALQDGAKKDEVAGAGNGFVSVFTLNGDFIQRIASGGTLNAPWGMAIAPAVFDQFGGDLLVGNFGDGTISAFKPGTGVFEGLLQDFNGGPVTIDGLWGLMIGNGGNSGSPNKIYFTAGPDEETHGLFGVLESVPEPATLALLGAGLAGFAIRRRKITPR